jgi:hypothetical protein
MSEESEDKQRTAQRLSALSSIFGKGTVPSSLADLINFNKRPRRRAPRGESVTTQLRRFKTRPVKENPEFDIVGRQVPDIETEVRKDIAENLGASALKVDPKMVDPVLKRLTPALQDLRRTIAPANKGTFVNVKTKLGRTKKTRIT